MSPKIYQRTIFWPETTSSFSPRASLRRRQGKNLIENDSAAAKMYSSRPKRQANYLALSMRESLLNEYSLSEAYRLAGGWPPPRFHFLLLDGHRGNSLSSVATVLSDKRAIIVRWSDQFSSSRIFNEIIIISHLLLIVSQMFIFWRIHWHARLLWIRSEI